MPEMPALQFGSSEKSAGPHVKLAKPFEVITVSEIGESKVVGCGDTGKHTERMLLVAEE